MDKTRTFEQVRQETREALKRIGFYPTEECQEAMQDPEEIASCRATLFRATLELEPADLFAVMALAQSLLLEIV